MPGKVLNFCTFEVSMNKRKRLCDVLLLCFLFADRGDVLIVMSSQEGV